MKWFVSFFSIFSPLCAHDWFGRFVRYRRLFTHFHWIHHTAPHFTQICQNVLCEINPDLQRQIFSNAADRILKLIWIPWLNEVWMAKLSSLLAFFFPDPWAILGPRHHTFICRLPVTCYADGLAQEQTGGRGGGQGVRKMMLKFSKCLPTLPPPLLSAGSFKYDFCLPSDFMAGFFSPFWILANCMISGLALIERHITSSEILVGSQS